MDTPPELRATQGSTQPKARPRALSINGRGVKPAEPRAVIIPGQFCIECQHIKPMTAFKRYSPSYRGKRKHHCTCKECERLKQSP